METVLGLILMVVFIVCVIAFASGVTWLVVKISPSKEARETSEAPGS